MNFQLIFSFISSVSTLLILVQLFLSHQYNKKAHEEQRRHKTVEVMMKWCDSLKKETSYAEKIVEKLNETQCRDLYLQTPFNVDMKIKKMLCEICNCKDSEECKICKSQEKTQHEVFDKQLLHLRWYVISYLNTLETILVSWDQGIVNKKVIEHEFSYLYNSEKGRDVLSNFRKVAGGIKNYPMIEKFCNTLKENEEKANKISSQKKL